jgi:hypothetical protein
LEETGLKIAIDNELGYTDDIWQNLGIHFVTLYFSATIVGGSLQNTEPDKVDRWFWDSPVNQPKLFAGAESIYPRLFEKHPSLYMPSMKS